MTFSGASIKANPASQMTARELEILRLLGRGHKIVEVADALDISYKTVANTTSLLKQKLGAEPFRPDTNRGRNRAGLTAVCPRQEHERPRLSARPSMPPVFAFIGAMDRRKQDPAKFAYH